MKVLLGLGGSPDELETLDEVVQRAREAGDDLTVAVIDTSSERSADEVEREIRDRLDELDFDATVRHLSGDPGSNLAEVAEREGYDRIVLAGGGRSPMGKIDIGDVAEFVLLNADVSVTLIR